MFGQINGWLIITNTVSTSSLLIIPNFPVKPLNHKFSLTTYMQAIILTFVVDMTTTGCKVAFQEMYFQKSKDVSW